MPVEIKLDTVYKLTERVDNPHDFYNSQYDCGFLDSKCSDSTTELCKKTTPTDISCVARISVLEYPSFTWITPEFGYIYAFDKLKSAMDWSESFGEFEVRRHRIWECKAVLSEIDPTMTYWLASLQRMKDFWRHPASFREATNGIPAGTVLCERIKLEKLMYQNGELL